MQLCLLSFLKAELASRVWPTVIDLQPWVILNVVLPILRIFFTLYHLPFQPDGFCGINRNDPQVRWTLWLIIALWLLQFSPVQRSALMFLAFCKCVPVYIDHTVFFSKGTLFVSKHFFFISPLSVTYEAGFLLLLKKWYQVQFTGPSHYFYHSLALYQKPIAVWIWNEVLENPCQYHEDPLNSLSSMVIC